METTSDLLTTAVGQVARVSLLLVHWAILEAYVAANMFQYIRPDVLGLSIPPLLNLVFVLLFTFTLLYIVDGVICCASVVRKSLTGKQRQQQQHLASSAETSNTNLETKSDLSAVESQRQPPTTMSFPFPNPVARKLCFVALSSLILPLCNLPLLDDHGMLRLAIYSIGMMVVPIHVRFACENEPSPLDVPISLAVSMSIRWVNFTDGVMHMTLVGSVIIALLAVTSHFLEEALRWRNALRSSRTSQTEVRHDRYDESQIDATRPLNDRALSEKSEDDDPAEAGPDKVWSVGIAMNFRRNSPGVRWTLVSRYSYLMVSCLSLGSLAWITYWVGLSPAVISRWSEVKHPFQVNCLLAWLSALGCIFAAFIPYREGLPLRPARAIPWLLIGLWTTGLTLQFTCTKWKALIGGCVITFILPTQWMYTLHSLSRFRVLYNANRGMLSLCMFLCGVSSLAFHIMGTFTVIPMLTTAFWGRMRPIFSVAVGVAALPIVVDMTCDVIVFITKRDMPSVMLSLASGKAGPRSRKRAYTALLMLVAFMTCISLYGFRLKVEPDLESYDQFSKPTFRVMTFNVMNGKSLRERPNLYATAALTAKYDADIVAFQESFAFLPFFAGVDNTYYIAASEGMHAHYGVNSLNDGGGDIGILSRIPFFAESAESYPKFGDVAVFSYGISKIEVPLRDADPRKPPTILSVISTHLVYSEATSGAGDLLQPQIDYLTDVLSSTPDPVVLLGDLNLSPSDLRLDFLYNNANMTSAFPGARNGTSAFQVSTTNDGSETEPIDHIFYRGLRLAETARVLNESGSISDHYPVTALFYVD